MLILHQWGVNQHVRMVVVDHIHPIHRPRHHLVLVHHILLQRQLQGYHVILFHWHLLLIKIIGNRKQKQMEQSQQLIL